MPTLLISYHIILYYIFIILFYFHQLNLIISFCQIWEMWGSFHLHCICSCISPQTVQVHKYDSSVIRLQFIAIYNLSDSHTYNMQNKSVSLSRIYFALFHLIIIRSSRQSRIHAERERERERERENLFPIS